MEVIDTQNENKLVTVLEQTATSYLVRLKRDERHFDADGFCSKCGFNHTVMRGQSTICTMCGVDAFVETKRRYTGIDCNQWFTGKDFNNRFNLPSR